MNICIIGAGLTGLRTAQRLLRCDRVRSLIVYERQSRIGGCWTSHNAEIAKLQCHTRFYAFHDQHWQEDMHLPHADSVVTYLEQFAHDHGLLRFIRLGVEVCDVTPARAHDMSTGLIVHTKDGRTRVFDVVVHTSHTSKPFNRF